MIELGQKVKDKVTGFTGIATAKIKFMNGCVQFHVQSRIAVPKKGQMPKFPEGQYIDVEQLDVIGKSKIILNERPDPSGGVRKYPGRS